VGKTIVLRTKQNQATMGREKGTDKNEGGLRENRSGKGFGF
jgi:hypothetical protein